jgi:hypothetical protein
MPLITICPRCTSHLALSGDVTPAAQVQCPICEVEFSLATVVPRELPQARLVDHADHADAEVEVEPDDLADQSTESAQERLSALLRSTAQWRPAAPSEEESAVDDDRALDEEPPRAIAATAKPAAADLKLGDSRLDQLLSDLIKEQPASPPESRFASHLAEAESLAVEFEPTQSPDFYADLDEVEETTQPESSRAAEPAPVPVFAGEAAADDLPSDLRTAPRRKRKPKLVRMLVGVVAGGMIGVGLGAYGLLWLRGPQGDFLGIARYLPPSMLPASVKQIAGDDAAANDSRDSEPPTSESTLAATPLPQPRFDSAVAPASVEEPVAEPGDPSAPDRLALAPEPSAPTLAPPPTESSSPTTSTTIVARLRGVHLHPLAELHEARDSANAALNEFLAGDLAQQQSWSTMGPAYIALAAFAEQFTLVEDVADQQDQLLEAQTAAKDVFRKLIGNAPRRADLATVAARWLQHDRRQNQGVILVGKVRNASPQGDLVEYTVDVPLGDSAVASRVLSSEASFNPGDDIAVVGAILPQPREQFAGYAGEASQVILAGWAFAPVALATPPSDAPSDSPARRP